MYLELSSQVQRGMQENFVRGFPAKAFAGTKIDFVRKGNEISGIEGIHINKFRAISEAIVKVDFFSKYQAKGSSCIVAVHFPPSFRILPLSWRVTETFFHISNRSISTAFGRTVYFSFSVNHSFACFFSSSIAASLSLRFSDVSSPYAGTTRMKACFDESATFSKNRDRISSMS